MEDTELLEERGSRRDLAPARSPVSTPGGRIPPAPESRNGATVHQRCGHEDSAHRTMNFRTGGKMYLNWYM